MGCVRMTPGIIIQYNNARHHTLPREESQGGILCCNNGSKNRWFELKTIPVGLANSPHIIYFSVFTNCRQNIPSWWEVRCGTRGGRLISDPYLAILSYTRCPTKVAEPPIKVYLIWKYTNIIDCTLPKPMHIYPISECGRLFLVFPKWSNFFTDHLCVISPCSTQY